MKKFILSCLGSIALLIGTMAYVANAAPITPISGGGTQTSTAPLNGYLLIGNALNTYSFIASSSLGSAGGGSVTSISQGNGITLTPSPITTTGSVAINTSTINALITAFGYITTSTATSTIAGGGGTATGPAFTFSTSTVSGKYNIVCSVATCVFTVPPASDYLASSTTFVATFNTRSGAVVLSSADVTTALGFSPISLVTGSNSIVSSGATTPNISLASSTASGTILIGSGNGQWAIALPTSTSPLAWTYASGTLTIGCATCLTGNQNITLIATGDATGTNSGTTSITHNLTITGLQGHALPAVATGTLYYSGGQWNLGNAVDLNNNAYQTSTAYTAAGTTIRTTGLTVATSGPLLSASVSGNTLTLTSLSTSTILSGYATSSNVAAGSCTNCNVTFNANGVATAFSTGSGGSTTPTSTFLAVTPTSSVVACNFPFYTTNGSATVSATSSICEDASGTIWFFSPKLPHAVFGTTTAPNTSLVFIASSTPIFNADANGNVIIGNVTSTSIVPKGPLEAEVNGVDVLTVTSGSIILASGTVNQSNGSFNIGGLLNASSGIAVTGTSTFSATSTFSGNVQIVPTSTLIATNASGTLITAPASSTGWEFLGSCIVTAASSTCNVGTIATRQQLEFRIDVAGYGGSDVVSLRFNNDSGANYWDRYLSSATTLSSFTNVQRVSQALLQLASASTTAAREVVETCSNELAHPKICTSQEQTDTGSAATAGTVDIGSGEWVNSVAQITSVLLTTSAGQTLLGSSSIEVFGKNP